LALKFPHILKFLEIFLKVNKIYWIDELFWVGGSIFLSSTLSHSPTHTLTRHLVLIISYFSRIIKVKRRKAWNLVLKLKINLIWYTIFGISIAICDSFHNVPIFWVVWSNDQNIVSVTKSLIWQTFTYSFTWLSPRKIII